MKSLNPTKTFFLMLIAALVVSSCQKKLDQQKTEDDTIIPSEVTMDNLEASAGFDWQNIQDAQISIFTKDNQNNAVPYVKVSLWTGFEEEGKRNYKWSDQ